MRKQAHVCAHLCTRAHVRHVQVNAVLEASGELEASYEAIAHSLPILDLPLDVLIERVPHAAGSPEPKPKPKPEPEPEPEREPEPEP